MSGNLSRKAITADLQAMRKVGIQGAIYMEVELFVPKGSVHYLCAEWRELMRHAMREATRLEITLDMNNGGGWAGAGGPWITPELSMQEVVWSETAVEGPKTVSPILSQPKTVEDYYNDIAVLAFPTPTGDSKRIADYSPRITYGANRKEFDYSKLLDGNPGTVTLLPLPPEGESQYLNIDFPELFTAQAVSIALDTGNLGQRFIPGAIQVSDDGHAYRTVRAMRLYEPHCSANFLRASARHYRILIEPDLLRATFSKGIPLAEVQLHEGPRIENIPGKALYTRQGCFTLSLDELSGQPEFPGDAVVRNEQILDLSKKMDSNGLLHWDVPPESGLSFGSDILRPE
jgi:alpha-L-rhamnosidase